MENKTASPGTRVRRLRIQWTQRTIGLIQTETEDLEEMDSEQLKAVYTALKTTYADTLEHGTNPIFAEIIKARKGQYCHCFEAETVYDLECLAESVINEYQYIYTEATIIAFLESFTIYATDDDTEDEVYSFSFTEYIKDTL